MAGLRSMLKSEDWMSLWIGLLIFALSLVLLTWVYTYFPVPPAP